jgi:hypothetical protein
MLHDRHLRNVKESAETTEMTYSWLFQVRLDAFNNAPQESSGNGSGAGG